MMIRLALRREGQFWNAYLAHMDTMENAKLIGSILIGVAEQNPEIKAEFKAVMEKTMAFAIKQVTGRTVAEFEERTAPEHERSGHG